MSSKPKLICNGNFVFVDEATVKCKHCSVTFKYHRSVSSLRYHLQAKHPFVPSDDSASNSVSVRQSKMDSFCRSTVPMSNEKYSSITNAVASWIAESARPLNIVNDPGLQNVIRVASGNMSFSMPSRFTISRQVDDMFNAQKAIVVAKLSSASCVALTADYWTSCGNDSYLGIVAHFIDDKCKLQSYTLAVRHSTERHFAANCAVEFESVAKEWSIHEKVSTFSTDNASNMVAALNRLPYRRLSCSAHSLQQGY